MVDTVSITKQKPSGHLTKAFRTVVSNRFFLILTIAGFSLVSVEEQLTNYIGVRMDNEISDPTPLLPYFSFEVDGVNLIGMLKTVNTLIVVSCTLVIAWMVSHYHEKFVLMCGLALFFYWLCNHQLSNNSMGRFRSDVDCLRWRNYVCADHSNDARK